MLKIIHSAADSILHALRVITRASLIYNEQVSATYGAADKEKLKELYRKLSDPNYSNPRIEQKVYQG